MIERTIDAKLTSTAKTSTVTRYVARSELFITAKFTMLCDLARRILIDANGLQFTSSETRGILGERIPRGKRKTLNSRLCKVKRSADKSSEIV